MTHPELRAELVRRAARIQAGQQSDQDEIGWFAAIVACRGWPGRRLAGADGAHAAFVLARQCPLPYRRAWLPKIRNAADRHDVSHRKLEELEQQLSQDAESQAHEVSRTDGQE